jgi:hypothetical protein
MSTPTLPAIGISKQDYVLGIATAATKNSPYKASLLGYLKHQPNDSLYYDSLGKKWRLHYFDPKPLFRKNRWNTILAHTVYNPIIDVEVRWEAVGHYQFCELKAVVAKCIEKDDDILTQYVEKEFLLEKLKQRANFGELIAMLNTYAFEVDEEALAKEFNQKE